MWGCLKCKYENCILKFQRLICIGMESPNLHNYFLFRVYCCPLFIDECRNYNSLQCSNDCRETGQKGELFADPDGCPWMDCRCTSCIETNNDCNSTCSEQGKLFNQSYCTAAQHVSVLVNHMTMTAVNHNAHSRGSK